MNNSKFLGKVIGIYLIIVSVMLFTNMQGNIDLINSLMTNAPLMFITGFITLILGLLLVVSHNVWQWNWRVIITLIGWMVLLKGLTILFFPRAIDETTTLFVQNLTVAYSFLGLDFIIGIVLVYFGFIAET